MSTFIDAYNGLGLVRTIRRRVREDSPDPIRLFREHKGYAQQPINTGSFRDSDGISTLVEFGYLDVKDDKGVAFPYVFGKGGVLEKIVERKDDDTGNPMYVITTEGNKYQVGNIVFAREVQRH